MTRNARPVTRTIGPALPTVLPHANLRLLAAAVDLIHAANLTPAALTLIAQRITDADEDRAGLRSGLAGGGHGSGISDPTAAAALPGINGYRDDAQARIDRETMRDDITALSHMARDMRNMITRLAAPGGHAVPLCDGRNYEGHGIPWTPHSRDDHNGWSDPTCRDGAGRSKLCPACLIRMNRWRERHGLERISDAEERAA